jgi:type IV pilus assembly protein PilW
MDKFRNFRKCIRQVGFSIVELMVAILIGLIILAGVIQVVVTSKTSFIGQEEMSFIQENARYAMDVIGKDVQGAGYWGCAGADARVALVAGVTNADAQPFLGLLSVQGFADETNAPAAYKNKLRAVDGTVKSESFIARSFSGPAINVETHAGTTLTLVDDHNIEAGNYVGVVAEDCRRIGIFRASAVTANTIAYTAAQNNSKTTIKPPTTENIVCPGACTSAYAQNYNPGTEVLNYMSHAYYIGTSTALPGFPVLKRAVLNNGTVIDEEIALGVEDMHLRYGERINNNLQYVTSNDVTNWNNVVAVEVSLLMRSQSPTLAVAAERKFADDTRTYYDRHMRQIVTSTFRIRNRI